MICPFCASTLDVAREHDLGEGETGGRATMSEYRCAGCDVVVKRTRVDKINQGSERWNLAREHPSRRSTSEATAGFAPCTTCGGPMISAMPPDHSPPPAYAMPSLGRPAHLDVMADARCGRCGAIEFRQIV